MLTRVGGVSGGGGAVRGEGLVFVAALLHECAKCLRVLVAEVFYTVDQGGACACVALVTYRGGARAGDQRLPRRAHTSVG